MGSTYKNPKNETRTLTQRGREVAYNGNANLNLSQNTPGEESNIIEWTCPEKFSRIDWVGGDHSVSFRPRTVETVSGTANDDTVVSLNANIIPVAGEKRIPEQPYPVARAVNVDQSTEVDIVDVDYAANEVTLGSDPADGETVKLYPILAEGTLLLKGYGQFDEQIGINERWGTPLETWHSMDQRDPDTAVHLGGEVHFTSSQTLAVVVDSPHQVVWTDGDYPDAYVSEIGFTVSVSV